MLTTQKLRNNFFGLKTAKYPWTNLLLPLIRKMRPQQMLSCPASKPDHRPDVEDLGQPFLRAQPAVILPDLPVRLMVDGWGPWLPANPRENRRPMRAACEKRSLCVHKEGCVGSPEPQTTRSSELINKTEPPRGNFSLNLNDNLEEIACCPLDTAALEALAPRTASNLFQSEGAPWALSTNLPLLSPICL